MSGCMSGVQACIRKTCPSAIYVHCASHCLNLTLSKSCEVPSIRNCQGVVNEVAVFFNRSAKRNDILKKAILNADVDSNRQQLRNLCETRWVERHDAIISFTLLYGPMLEALDECSRTRDKDTAVKAGLLKAASTQPDFIVALCVLTHILALTQSLSVSLQTVNIDLFKALSSVNDLLAVLRDKRENAGECFSDIWKDCLELAKYPQVDIVPPRQASRSRHRANVPADSPEEFYRRSQFVPFVEMMINELESRFTTHSEAVCRLTCVIPEFVKEYTYSHLQPAVHLYAQFLASDIIVKAKFEIWKKRWTANAKASVDCTVKPDIIKPSNALHALSVCN